MAPDAATLVLMAPLSGVMVPLADVPDPVFAAKMVGDGISVDPTSQCLLAPCAGKVTLVHSAGHALTIVHASGVEVMMHIGLDTVGLKGEGFRPLVRTDQAVEAGHPLIEFDADFLARKAKSLLTQTIVTNGERVAGMEAATGWVTAGKDVALRVRLKAVAAAAASPSGDGVGELSEPVVVPNPLGLHARPAAVLAGCARHFRCDVEIVRGTDRANAKSVVSLMTLDVKKGDTVRFMARGADAGEALAALVEAVGSGLGEGTDAVVEAPVESLPVEAEPGVLRGIPASPGLAVGRIFQVRAREIQVAEQGGDAARERRSLERALDQARAELEALEGRVGAERGAIFAAHRELLDDPDLTDGAWPSIAAGKSAAWAWRKAYTAQAERLSSMQNALLAGRANDLRDVGERVLRTLTGETHEPIEVPADSILIAEDLTPSDTATLDRGRVLGFATLRGGATSHVAILARSLDLPALAGTDPRAAEIPDGTLAVLDGTRGSLRVDPSAEEVETIRGRLREQDERRRVLLAKSAEAAVTRDGKAIEVAANLGGAAEADRAVQLGAEGVGLLRSEFLFMERATPPSEDEQAEIYATVARALGTERRLIIRTLDVGGDKPLPYLPIGAEANPFLGERGLRVGLARPELLRTQFRAILRAAGLAKLGVMLPMVTHLDEFRRARAIFEEERARLNAPDVPLGIMIEVPAAALTASVLAREAAFFSIGTNDLTQYTLAVDRGHPRLAAMADGLHPAVLRLIQMTVEGAHAHGRWVGVCGGLAGEPAAIPLLVGLGVDELSVAVPSVPGVKQAVRDLDTGQCRKLAERALILDSAAAVRALTEVGS